MHQNPTVSQNVRGQLTLLGFGRNSHFVFQIEPVDWEQQKKAHVECALGVLGKLQTNWQGLAGKGRAGK
ncbi:MAG: hypothetical protein EA342_01670 [Leptolyngbya sp. LCM1.Bin17]|nr:MAG: hypothetical protein EA342_01670 [Leptolyngbya sp. LCM1.Bin17]